MTPPEPGKSSCHQAPVRVASGDDSDIGNKTSVTNWYECTRCSEPCDLVLTTDQPQTPDTQPSLEEILHQVWHDGYDSVHMIVPQEKTVKEAKQAILAYFKSLVPEKRSLDDEPLDKDGVPYRYDRAEVYAFNQAINQFHKNIGGSDERN